MPTSVISVEICQSATWLVTALSGPSTSTTRIFATCSRAASATRCARRVTSYAAGRSCRAMRSRNSGRSRTSASRSARARSSASSAATAPARARCSRSCRASPSRPRAASLRGRVASLLEVGTGFHPELTGRENIYLNGAILGMSRAEIRRKFDEIVAFAEVGKFLDTPVKRYSRACMCASPSPSPRISNPRSWSSTRARGRRRRISEKMPRQNGRRSRREGRTVLFVSHNLVAIRSLCTHAIMLRGGRLTKVVRTRGMWCRRTLVPG